MQQQQRPGLSGLERSETSKSVNSGVSARVPSSSSHNYHPNVTPSSKGNPLDSIFSFGPSSSAPTALPLAASTAIGIPENTKAVSDPWDLDFLAGPQKSNPATAPLSIPTSTAAATSTTRQTGDIFDLDFLEKQPSAMGSVMSSSASSLSLPPLSPPRPETSHSFHSDPQRPASSPMARPPDSSPSNNTNGVGVSHRDADLERLISAGFAPEEARNAIEASGGDVQMAVELLFENRGGYQQHQRDSSSSPVVREELSSPVHDKISFWESKQQQSTSGPDKLASRASAFGASFLKSAKTALDYSKRKITEAVEKAVEAHQTHQSSSPARSFATGKTPPRDWHPPSSFAPYKDADANNEGPPPSNFTPPHDKASPAPKLVLQKPSKKEAVSNPPTPLLMDLAPPKYSSPSTVPNVKQRAVNLFDDDSSSPVTTKHSATIAHTADFAVALPKASPPAQPPKKALVQASPSQLSESAEYKEKGNTQFKAGQYAEAEMWYSKAIDCLPSGHSSLAPLYNNRAGARLKTGSYNEAVRDCNLVQELEPNELKSLLRRASAYEALEKWEYAQSDYRSIMAIDSCVKSASRGLARCTKALKPLKAEETMELDFLGNPVTPKASPSSGLQDLQSRSKSISTSSAQVKHAVDAAVQQVRAKHQQAEDEEVMKLALKDQTDDKVGICFHSFFTYLLK